MKFSHLTDINQRDTVKPFLTDCDTYSKAFIQRDDFSTDAQHQQNMNNLLNNLMFLFCEPFHQLNLVRLLNLRDL